MEAFSSYTNSAESFQDSPSRSVTCCQFYSAKNFLLILMCPFQMRFEVVMSVKFTFESDSLVLTSTIKIYSVRRSIKTEIANLQRSIFTKLFYT